jgi:hypothetical protein
MISENLSTYNDIITGLVLLVTALNILFFFINHILLCIINKKLDVFYEIFIDEKSVINNELKKVYESTHQIKLKNEESETIYENNESKESI